MNSYYTTRIISNIITEKIREYLHNLTSDFTSNDYKINFATMINNNTKTIINEFYQSNNYQYIIENELHYNIDYGFDLNDKYVDIVINAIEYLKKLYIFATRYELDDNIKTEICKFYNILFIDYNFGYCTPRCISPEKEKMTPPPIIRVVR
jgi:hypothetical protein